MKVRPIQIGDTVVVTESPRINDPSEAQKGETGKVEYITRWDYGSRYYFSVETGKLKSAMGWRVQKVES